jgi:hypothetical protein
MNPEEYLDRLIERREHGQEQLPVTNDEIAANLAAAERLAQLQEIEVPPGFASRLELAVRARSRDLARQNGGIIPMASPQDSEGSQRFPRRRAWVVVLRIAAVLMLACVGILTASTRSLPGDALYIMKQAEHQFTLTFASAPQDRASLQIDQLRGALVDLSTVVNDGRDDDAIRLALDTVAAKTNDSREAVAALSAGPERATAQRSLDGVLAGEEQTLRHLLDHVDWPMRLAFTQQLGALGDPVPTVTHVMLRPQSNGTLLITLTGTHFAPQAELIIDGQPAGMVIQTTSEQLVAVISNSAWSPGSYAVGIRNPDGTAAQKVLNEDDNHYHSRQATPGPTRGPYDE